LKISYLIPFLLLLLAAACSPAALTNTIAPLPPTDTPALTPTDTPAPAQKAIRVSLVDLASTGYNAVIDFGNNSQLQLTLDPVFLSVSFNPDGSVSSTSTRAWTSAAPKDMKICFSLDQPCPLAALDWRPFQAETIMDYPVDWLGARKVFAAVQVRGADGQVIPVFLDSETATKLQVVASYALTGQINLKTPVEKQPSPVLTALAATRVAFPVTGSVLIEGGACCKGGVAGTTVTLKVAFSASSSAGQVTEMRVRTGSGCSKDATTLDTPWEPFEPARTFSAQLALNWVGWYASVQYRDDQGNLSPVYCDDISLEGSPPTPTQ
jgi:hypothetical protein